MGHGHCHVLFDSTPGDPQSFGNFAVIEPIELVHAKHTLSACRQLGNGIGQLPRLIAFDQPMFRIWRRIRDFGRSRMRPMLMRSPVALAPLAPPRLAKPVEDQVVCHFEKIALRIGDGTRLSLAHPYPELTQKIVCVGLASGSRHEKPVKPGALFPQRHEQVLIGNKRH